MFSDSDEETLEVKFEYITSLSKEESSKEDKNKKPESKNIYSKPVEHTTKLEPSFKVEAQESKEIKKKPIWGLEVKKNPKENLKTHSNDIPILLRNRPVELEKCKSEGERFAKDLSSRPSEPTKESYSKIPVEEFGATILKGMGWKGPNSSETNVPIKYVPRPERLGLGASEVQDSSELKQRKPIEQSLGLEMSKNEEKRMKQLDQKKSNKPLELLQTHANVIGIDETAPKRVKLHVSIGSRIVICNGEHSGLKGLVKNESKDGKFWIIELEINEQSVLVPKPHVKLRDYKSEVIVQTTEDNKDLIADLWVCSGLKVKIKSKSFSKGQFYNRKGIILDVHPDKTCNIKLLDNANEFASNVPQWSLQTCLPRAANSARPTVKYLKKDRGDELFHAACRVLEFDDEGGRAVVQVDENLEEVFEVHYDDICEFIS